MRAGVVVGLAMQLQPYALATFYSSDPPQQERARAMCALTCFSLALHCILWTFLAIPHVTIRMTHNHIESSHGSNPNRDVEGGRIADPEGSADRGHNSTCANLR